MRRIAGFVVIALTGSLALADDGSPPPAPAPNPVAPTAPASRLPLRVVRVMPESHQALLFDKTRGTHVLAEVGGTVGGFRVDAIGEDDVTLSTGRGGQIVLAAPDHGWRRNRRIAERDAAPTKSLPADPYAPPKAPAVKQPVDPYASTTQPVDPYADPEIHSVEAPATVDNDLPPGGVNVVSAGGADPSAPASVATAPTAPTTPTAAPTAPTAAPAATAPTAAPVETAPTAPTTAPVTTTPTAPTATPTAPTAVPTTAVPAPTAPVTGPLETTLTRGEVRVALADFGRLTSGIRAELTPAGAHVASIADGSVFAKAGLRAGDMITAVDGKPMHSIDDAADVYVRATTARNITVQLIRNGKPAMLKLSIQ